MCTAGMDPEELGLGSGPYEAGGLLKGQKAQGKGAGRTCLYPPPLPYWFPLPLQTLLLDVRRGGGGRD